MNANEFRIGNWYSQFGNLHQVTWDTIKALGDAPETQLWCKPIPLSPEILEKFGFGKDISSQYGGYLIKVKEGESIRIVNDESIGWHWPMNGYNRPITNYIHQLQNLIFALTGEELPHTT
jgi:hypothetical protein